MCAFALIVNSSATANQSPIACAQNITYLCVYFLICLFIIIGLSMVPNYIWVTGMRLLPSMLLSMFCVFAACQTPPPIIYRKSVNIPVSNFRLTQPLLTRRFLRLACCWLSFGCVFSFTGDTPLCHHSHPEGIAALLISKKMTLDTLMGLGIGMSNAFGE